nr:immunoglobulin heavy chain junction region [Macaca mulatta]MOW88813.1 immunoglobulin heavy chain junction region [Macaca mulatta]MOW88971.1 immunoglobulin heavy chain junction region [Macaca mulatta]MOW89902.1 immunoglobulin heavy chain junction region [Macaca mulatta]MOW90183.1 immunoglobulin heavy chain junction region [Macaca mulatta]
CARRAAGIYGLGSW